MSAPPPPPPKTASSLLQQQKQRSFANYPVACECTQTKFRPEEDNNPAMRGLALVAASTLVTKLGFAQRHLWSNAGFGVPRGMTQQLGVTSFRSQPSVIPLADGSSPVATVEELTAPPAATTAEATKGGRFYSAADYHRLYRSGEATPLQVVEALLPFVRQHGASPPTEHGAAWTACNADEVLLHARASTERWAAGRPLGVLDGVPFSVKCDTDVEGYTSTFGMRVDKAHAFFDRAADKTVWPVRKLREAGAIMVGQNNMHEIGMDTTGCNPATGTPTNWYNKSYYPGGSSSGGGSVIGGGLVPIAVGTDAGGSIRIPAAFNGGFGLKVTHDRTLAMDSTVCVTGPLAATASDLAVAYRVMAQPDPSCPVQGRFVPPSAGPSSTSSSASSSEKKLLGVPRDWIEQSCTPVVKKAFYAAVEHLCSAGGAGYEVVDVSLPHLREGQLAHAATCLVEAARQATARVDSSRGEHFTALLNHANRILLSVGQHSSGVDYLAYGALCSVLKSHLAHLFAAHPSLLIVTPTTPTAGWARHPADASHGFTDGNASLRNMRFVWLANTTGCPAVSAPMGYADPDKGQGPVPMGIMALGEWGAEEDLLAFAADVERYLTGEGGLEGGRLLPDGWVDVLALAKGRVASAQKLADDGAEGVGSPESE